MNTLISRYVRYSTILLLSLFASVSFAQTNNTYVVLETSVGNIEIELYDQRAPKTVANFLAYVKEGYYENTLFHRVIPNFMVQGGGFDKSFARKPTKAPIKNEANAFIPNIRGTISMARTNDPHSATSQFFINVVNNKSLNKSAYSDGYAVFGKVSEGIEIADKMSKVKTKVEGHMRDVPAEPIIIKRVSIKQNLESETATP